ncbi:hypothetical protein HK105_200651 [Polyrhizophydium stewartii]|uniref:GAF domain-containing protein n=1 Tax=Polyrhizophydium stewartii TaxID=2732419 RepID=A0ABR4NJQ3_9FUNG|nr:hypothetical protein HK105_004225 [Polyrhizophydium stewartii]
MSPPTASSYPADKPSFYRDVVAQTRAVVDPSLPLVSNLANVAALLYWAYHDPAVARPVNWVGFYLRSAARPDTLLLGPFHGRVACTSIRIGQGVCGTAADERRSVLVRNVHEFKGHIACDSASESELVVPLVHPDGRLLGVFDLDSTVLAGFDEVDQAGVEAITAALIETVASWSFE